MDRFIFFASFIRIYSGSVLFPFVHAAVFFLCVTYLKNQPASMVKAISSARLSSAQLSCFISKHSLEEPGRRPARVLPCRDVLRLFYHYCHWARKLHSTVFGTNLHYSLGTLFMSPGGAIGAVFSSSLLIKRCSSGRFLLRLLWIIYRRVLLGQNIFIPTMKGKIEKLPRLVLQQENN